MSTYQAHNRPDLSLRRALRTGTRSPSRHWIAHPFLELETRLRASHHLNEAARPQNLSPDL